MNGSLQKWWEVQIYMYYCIVFDESSFPTSQPRLSVTLSYTTFMIESTSNNAIPWSILQPACTCVQCFVVPDPGASDDKNLPSCTAVEAKTGGKQHSTNDTKKATFV